MNTFPHSSHVEIEKFCGPLEMLVYLVQKRELPAQDLELANLLLPIESHDFTDLEEGATLAEQIALLICLKSRTLIPFNEEEEPLLMSPEEALQRLKEFARFKFPANFLVEKELEEQRALPRGEVPILTKERQEGLGIEHITIDELKGLFAKAQKRLNIIEERMIKQKWSVHEAIDDLMLKLNQILKLEVLPYLIEMSCKEQLICTFLAVLELLKEGKIILTRSEDSEICLMKS